MARKPTPVTEPAQAPAMNHAAVEVLEKNVVALASAQAAYGQGRDLVNQLLGQAQAFRAAGDLLQTFGVSKLAIVKENKLYQQLAGSKTPNGLELKGTWAEFCGLLGMSDEKVNQDIANLQAFGEAALEAMQRAGIGYRDLRQFRKLPADQQTALIEAAKEGDKATLLELAEDLISKHLKEKQALESDLEKSNGIAESQEKLIASKDSMINKLTSSKMRGAPTDWQKELKAPISQVSHFRTEIERALGGLDVLRDQAMSLEAPPGEEAELEQARAALGAALRDAVQRAREVLEAVEASFDATLGALIGD